MQKKYQSFSELYCLEQATFIQRLQRDFRLFVALFMQTWMWATRGRKIRKEFANCRRTGRPFYVDKYDPARRPE